MNITGQTVFQNIVQEPLFVYKIQNTTEICHTFVHQYKAPNHDKLLYLQIPKNYSVTQIIE